MDKTNDEKVLFAVGDRGAGKTSFLGSLLTELQDDDAEVVLLAVDMTTEQKVTKLLNYCKSEDLYPPATVQIEEFCLSLKRKQGRSTLLRWLDFPGEECDLTSPAFITMLGKADYYVIFLDGEILLQNDVASIKGLQMLKTVSDLMLATQDIAQKPTAVVITKSDLVPSRDKSFSLTSSARSCDKQIQRFIDRKQRVRLFNSTVSLEEKTGLVRNPIAREVLLWLEGDETVPKTSFSRKNMAIEWGLKRLAQFDRLGSATKMAIAFILLLLFVFTSLFLGRRHEVPAVEPNSNAEHSDL